MYINTLIALLLLGVLLCVLSYELFRMLTKISKLVIIYRYTKVYNVSWQTAKIIYKIKYVDKLWR